VTHAFFKALLFLAAGSVMHAMHDVIDMRALGGLARPLRWTAGGFVIGTLAIAGIPPFAGFFSKDLILEQAFALGQTTGNYVPYLLGLLTAFVTAVYMTRAAVLTFFSPADAGHQDGVRPHESPLVMLLPMAALAVLSIGGGLLGARAVGAPLLQWLTPLIGVAPGEGAAPHPPVALLTALSVGVGLAGLVVAWRTYRTRREPDFGRLRGVLDRRWYIDEIYETVITRPAQVLARTLAGPVDLGIIDRAVNGVGVAASRLGTAARRLQTGYARQYALGLLIGTILILGYWVLW
jgi:NADH-quinone oxidoreductase subunit L